jgi:hypothetical protein
LKPIDTKIKIIMKIKHKAGSFQEQWYLNILSVFEHIFYRTMWLLFNCKVKVIGIYNFDFIHTPDSENDWRKIWGSKSGIKTKTNYEEIAVNRIIEVGNKWFVEQAKYIRTLDKFKAVDIDSGKIVPFGDAVVLETIIEPKYKLYVSAYAGGDEINIDNYSYRRKLRPYWGDFKLFKNLKHIFSYGQ